MSTEEWQEFVTRTAHTAKLATIGADGAPRITPVWYVLDGTDFLFTAGDDTAKMHNLRRDPRAAICIDDEAPPYAYVQARGDVTFSEDPDELAEVATRAGGRYMGPDRAAEFGQRNSVPGEVLVRLRPWKVVAHSGIAD